MNYTVQHLFPTPVVIHQYNCTEEIRAGLDCVPMMNAHSNELSPFGDMSSSSYVLEDPVYEPLVKFITDTSTDVMKNILCYDIEETQIIQSWVSHKKPNEYHGIHAHANSVLSGVYYFNECDYEPITFYKATSTGVVNRIELPLDMERAKTSPCAWQHYYYKPSKGTLILIPSYMQHSVGVNKTNQVRKSLAFNVIPTIRFGRTSTASEILFSKLK